MKDKKPVLITIVVLLLVFTPLTVISAFIKVGKNPLDENPGHDFHYDNKLWFYDENNKLISSYECKTAKCDLAVSTITDQEYGINYYQDGKLTKVNNNNKFTFIKDGALTYLINVSNGTVLQKYLQIKNYNTKVEDDIYILQNENKLWGSLSIGETLSAVIPFEYDFLAILNNTSDDYLKVDNFIALKDNKWSLIDKNNTKISDSYNEPIIDYNNKYIVTKQNNRIKIYNYEGLEYLSNLNFSDYALYNDYVGLVMNNMVYIYNDLNNNYLKNITINSTGKLMIEEKDNRIAIKIGDNIVDYLN